MPTGPDYVADAIALGVDEVMIDRLVRHFYAAVRLDAALGPIFAARIAGLGAASPADGRISGRR
jgi:truncated hemoglobin YjbI